MLISRKKFLKISGGAVAGIALSNVWLPRLLNAASAKNGKGRLPLIWFQSQACSGCPVSLINTEYPGIDEVLIEVITLDYNPVVMAGTGDVALDVIRRMIKDEKGQYILAVDGSIPLDEDGEYCTVGEVDGKPITALEWIKQIGNNSLAVVAIGSCASWGGIPAATPNPTGAVPASDVIKDKPIINIPGNVHRGKDPEYTGCIDIKPAQDKQHHRYKVYGMHYPGYYRMLEYVLHLCSPHIRYLS